MGMIPDRRVIVDPALFHHPELCHEILGEVRGSPGIKAVAKVIRDSDRVEFFLQRLAKSRVVNHFARSRSFGKRGVVQRTCVDEVGGRVVRTDKFPG